jgi:hypothetical protein
VKDTDVDVDDKVPGTPVQYVDPTQVASVTGNHNLIDTPADNDSKPQQGLLLTTTTRHSNVLLLSLYGKAWLPALH